MPLPYSSDLSGSTPFAGGALERVKGMFLEMPGTEWTVPEAARLAGLDTAVCRAILEGTPTHGIRLAARQWGLRSLHVANAASVRNRRDTHG